MHSFQKQGLIKVTSAVVIIIVFISIYCLSYRNFQYVASLRKVYYEVRDILAVADMIDIQVRNIFHDFLGAHFNSTEHFKSAFKNQLKNLLNYLNSSLGVQILMSEQVRKENDTYSCFLLCFRIEKGYLYAKVCRIFEFTIINGTLTQAYSERVIPKL